MVVVDLEDTTVLADLEIPLRVRSDRIKSIRYGALELRLRSGLSLELPLKVAVPLLKEKIAEIDYSKLPSLQDLNKVRWKEERTEELQPLDEGFYVRARLYLASLRDKDDYNTEVVFRRAKSTLVDIITIRMKKIVRYALASPQPQRELMSKMSHEERMFYIALCHLIDEWFTRMLAKLERGGI